MDIKCLFPVVNNEWVMRLLTGKFNLLWVSFENEETKVLDKCKNVYVIKMVLKIYRNYLFVYGSLIGNYNVSLNDCFYVDYLKNYKNSNTDHTRYNIRFLNRPKTCWFFFKNWLVRTIKDCSTKVCYDCLHSCTYLKISKVDF